MSSEKLSKPSPDKGLIIEKDYNSKGYPLVRVVIPTQELEPEEATVFIKVIDYTTV